MSNKEPFTPEKLPKAYYFPTPAKTLSKKDKEICIKDNGVESLAPSQSYFTMVKQPILSNAAIPSSNTGNNTTLSVTDSATTIVSSNMLLEEWPSTDELSNPSVEHKSEKAMMIRRFKHDPPLSRAERTKRNKTDSSSALRTVSSSQSDRNVEEGTLSRVLSKENEPAEENVQQDSMTTLSASIGSSSSTSPSGMSSVSTASRLPQVSTDMNDSFNEKTERLLSECLDHPPSSTPKTTRLPSIGRSPSRLQAQTRLPSSYNFWGSVEAENEDILQRWRMARKLELARNNPIIPSRQRFEDCSSLELQMGGVPFHSVHLPNSPTRPTDIPRSHDTASSVPKEVTCGCHSMCQSQCDSKQECEQCTIKCCTLMHSNRGSHQHRPLPGCHCKSPSRKCSCVSVCYCNRPDSSIAPQSCLCKCYNRCHHGNCQCGKKKVCKLKKHSEQRYEAHSKPVQQRREKSLLKNKFHSPEEECCPTCSQEQASQEHHNSKKFEEEVTKRPSVRYFSGSILSSPNETALMGDGSDWDLGTSTPRRPHMQTVSPKRQLDVSHEEAAAKRRERHAKKKVKSPLHRSRSAPGRTTEYDKPKVVQGDIEQMVQQVVSEHFSLSRSDPNLVPTALPNESAIDNSPQITKEHSSLPKITAGICTIPSKAEGLKPEGNPSTKNASARDSRGDVLPWCEDLGDAFLKMLIGRARFYEKAIR